MCKTRELTQQRLKELLEYNLETGVFVWREARGRVKVGAQAGKFDKDGYIIITIDSVPHKAHRLVWLYLYNNHPSSLIDHVNHIKTDNRFSNLREATHSQNNMNRGKLLVSNLPKGVYYSKKINRYIAQISINGKTKHIASCTTPEEASAKYQEEAIKIQGEFFFTSE